MQYIKKCIKVVCTLNFYSENISPGLCYWILMYNNQQVTDKNTQHMRIVEQLSSGAENAFYILFRGIFSESHFFPNSLTNGYFYLSVGVKAINVSINKYTEKGISIGHYHYYIDHTSCHIFAVPMYNLLKMLTALVMPKTATFGWWKSWYLDKYLSDFLYSFVFGSFYHSWFMYQFYLDKEYLRFFLDRNTCFIKSAHLIVTGPTT